MTIRKPPLFIKFDIVDFYSSISRDLLIDSINFAKNYMDIMDSEFNIILAARKSLLSLNNSTWMKCKNEDFDIPRGAYDSVQVANIVGIYILEILSRIIDPKQISLYRDDRLIYIPNSNGPLTMKLQKKLLELSSSWGSR